LAPFIFQGIVPESEGRSHNSHALLPLPAFIPCTSMMTVANC
jgi:hypothetical protein